MQGHIDMGGNPIINIKSFVEDDSSQASLDALKNHVINFDYFHTQRSELKKLINEVSADALNGKNLDPMGRNIDMENVFERVMENDLFKEDDSDLHKVGSVNKDYHKVNQKTYLFRIDYDSQIGYYSMRLSIDLVYLPVGNYTMAFELYSSNMIDTDEITINAESETFSVTKINTKTSRDHTGSIIDFYKAIVYPSLDDLDIDISLKNKAGAAYEYDTHIFVVVYGVSGLQNDVDSIIWDRFYYIKNKKSSF